MAGDPKEMGADDLTASSLSPSTSHIVSHTSNVETERRPSFPENDDFCTPTVPLPQAALGQLPQPKELVELVTLYFDSVHRE